MYSVVCECVCAQVATAANERHALLSSHHCRGNNQSRDIISAPSLPVTLFLRVR